MPRIRFKDIEIHFTTEGSGPAVVLLHGFLEASWMWENITPHLSKTHKVVCIDLPGHGKSDCIGYIHSLLLDTGPMLFCGPFRFSSNG